MSMFLLYKSQDPENIDLDLKIHLFPAVGLLIIGSNYSGADAAYREDE